MVTSSTSEARLFHGTWTSGEKNSNMLCVPAAALAMLDGRPPLFFFFILFLWCLATTPRFLLDRLEGGGALRWALRWRSQS